MFANLFGVLLIEIQEEIHDFAGWEGGLRGTKIVNKNIVNKLAFPKNYYLRKIILKNYFQKNYEFHA